MDRIALVLPFPFDGKSRYSKQNLLAGLSGALASRSERSLPESDTPWFSWMFSSRSTPLLIIFVYQL